MTSNPEVVRIQDLTRTFLAQTEVRLFNGLSLTVYDGDFVAVTGATGCGKTTLLNIISGLDRPTSGNVTVLGKEITNLNDDAVTDLRAKEIGIVFQTSGLMPGLSVSENIELPLVMRHVSGNERQQKVQEISEFFGLSKKKSASIMSLSVGERKKVAIARAVITEPRLLLLDEPTAGLDTPTINILTPMLRGMHYLHSRTIVMATNNLEVAKIAAKEVPIERPMIMTVQKTEK